MSYVLPILRRSAFGHVRVSSIPKMSICSMNHSCTVSSPSLVSGSMTLRDFHVASPCASCRECCQTQLYKGPINPTLFTCQNESRYSHQSTAAVRSEYCLQEMVPPSNRCREASQRHASKLSPRRKTPAATGFSTP